MAHTGLAGLIAKCSSQLQPAIPSLSGPLSPPASSVSSYRLALASGRGGPVVIPAAVSLGADPGGCYRYGCANSQHDPALLGIACRAPCRSPGRLSWHRCFSLPRGMSPTQLPDVDPQRRLWFERQRSIAGIWCCIRLTATFSMTATGARRVSITRCGLLALGSWASNIGHLSAPRRAGPHQRRPPRQPGARIYNRQQSPYRTPAACSPGRLTHRATRRR
jgi:hypothetical protein